MAVGIRARHPRTADGAAGAGDVLDDDAPSDFFSDPLRDQPRHGVARTARRKRDDDRDLARWERLLGMRSGSRQDEKTGDEGERAHGISEKRLCKALIACYM